jgi:hypothetical protein
VPGNGLYDMQRRIRRAGVEYRRIVLDWGGVLADSGAECAAVLPGV